MSTNKNDATKKTVTFSKCQDNMKMNFMKRQPVLILNRYKPDTEKYNQNETDKQQDYLRSSTLKKSIR